MYDKLLIVSVAAYNMEQYIHRALESVMIPKWMDFIEVLVINDGSTDRTAEVVLSFAERAPETFKLINKENGGWGSTVNRAIKEASGKYFKLLDADDWFNRDGLSGLMDLLSANDTDLVITPVIAADKETYQILPMFFEPEKYPENTSLDFYDMNVRSLITMHGMTIRTEILKKLKNPITENCFYTDSEFTHYCLKNINDCMVQYMPVYVYYRGRPESSCSDEGVTKYNDDRYLVLDKLLELRFEYGIKEDNKTELLEKNNQPDGS